jgi:hypothetical protein
MIQLQVTNETMTRTKKIASTIENPVTRIER